MAYIKREGVWNPIHTFTVMMQMPVLSVLSFLLCGAACFRVNVTGMRDNVLHIHRNMGRKVSSLYTHLRAVP